MASTGRITVMSHLWEISPNERGRAMLPQNLTSDILAGEQRIYIACGVEDLISVEMDAWKRGYDRAEADGLAALQDMAAVERAAQAACDVALEVYVPLDQARFCDVFVRAWCGGYFTQLRESQPRVASTIAG